MSLDNYIPWIVCGTIGTVASVGTIAWAKNYYDQIKEENKEMIEAWKDMIRHIRIDNNPELLSTVEELCQIGRGEYQK